METVIEEGRPHDETDDLFLVLDGELIALRPDGRPHAMPIWGAWVDGHWYVEGGLADTIDGRFAMLATICALVTVRLESGDESLTVLSELQVERALIHRALEKCDGVKTRAADFLGINRNTLNKKVKDLNIDTSD